MLAEPSLSANQVLKAADTALYRTKSNGKNRAVLGERTPSTAGPGSARRGSG